MIGQRGVEAKKQQAQTIDRSGFDLQGNENTSQAINFRLVGGDRQQLWDVTSPSFTSSADSAVNFYRRGLCALAQQHPQSAVAYLKQAVDAGPPDTANVYRIGCLPLAGDQNRRRGRRKARPRRVAGLQATRGLGHTAMALDGFLLSPPTDF